MGWAGNVLLLLASAIAILLWRRTRTRTARLLALALVVFTVGTLLGYLPWAVGEHLLAATIAKFRFLLTLSFPYLLLRFANSFEPVARPVLRGATLGLAAIAIYIVAVPANFGSPSIDTSRPELAWAFRAVIAWLVLVMPITAVHLLRAGRGQPGVARRRMRLLGIATLLMLAAYVTAFLSPSYALTATRMASYLMVDLSAVALLLGFAPPVWLRAYWRRDEEHALRLATLDLMSATTRDEVLAGFLPKVVRLVGARSAALVRPDGTIVGVPGTPHEEATRLVLEAGASGRNADGLLTVVGFGEDRIALVTSPVTPLLGQEERALLGWLGVVVELALARCERLAEQDAITGRLRELDRLKSEFVQIVAHDLRSPMATIGGLASTLRVNWDELDQPAREQILDHIRASTSRMADLVVDVLDVARIETGELHFAMAQLDLAQLVQDAVAEARIGNPARVIELELAGEVPPVVGDTVRVRQVVDNLVSNALKYSDVGEPVHVRVAAAGEEALVSVRDAGRGIASDDQPRIFEKFGRASSARGVPGSGLGLYICRAIIEAHEGRIWVDSTVGVGSTFAFTIPCVVPARVTALH